MADLFIVALTVFTFQNNIKIAINIYLLEIFAVFLVFSYQFTAKCLSLPPPLLGGAISKPLTLPFALAFRTSNIETVVLGAQKSIKTHSFPQEKCYQFFNFLTRKILITLNRFFICLLDFLFVSPAFPH